MSKKSTSRAQQEGRPARKDVKSEHEEILERATSDEDVWEGLGGSEAGEPQNIVKFNGTGSANNNAHKAETKAAKRQKKESRKKLAEKNETHATGNAFGVLGTADEDEDNADDDDDGECS